MPLTHVCVWDSEIGYRKITAEDASKLCSYGVSVGNSDFVCELCTQSVGFTKPRKGTGTQYFYHSRGEQDKDCEDRAQTYDRNIMALNNHVMPLRIAIQNSRIYFELGFFFSDRYTSPAEKQFVIKIYGSLPKPIVYYSDDRLENNGITYLSVGSEPVEEYRIEYENLANDYANFWPTTTQGVSPKGSFFNLKSRKILHSGSKAKVDESYYLLQSRKLMFDDVPRDITAKLITQIDSIKSGKWYLYQIDIKTFSKSAAYFFLQRSVFLTEKSVKFYPIYPPYIKTPYFIYHNSTVFYFYLCGDDAELKSYPAAVNLLKTDNGRLYKLYTREREQLVSLGKSGALGFSYLIKQPLSKKVLLPTVEIFDQSGTILDEETYSNLPVSKLIFVLSRYDGKAVVKQKGKIVFIYRLVAGQRLLIDGLSLGISIHFYQGYDCIRTLSFENKESTYDVSVLDDVLVKKLNSCSGPRVHLSHSFASIIRRYTAYPKTRQWILKMIRQGEIPRSAYSLLKKQIISNK